jgi:hypothetical protein
LYVHNLGNGSRADSFELIYLSLNITAGIPRVAQLHWLRQDDSLPDFQADENPRGRFFSNPFA